MQKHNDGFSLIELMVVIIVVVALAVFFIPKNENNANKARSALVTQLYSTVNSGVQQVKGESAGTVNLGAGSGWVMMGKNFKVRVLNGFPDKWCDGVGLLGGAVIPANGCYMSPLGVHADKFTFYGYGNTQIPGKDTGWRIESAPNPVHCSVGYHYEGSGIPVIKPYTDGC